MADHTHIEWTDATWNPVTGCSKVSAGCKHCYAERDWARLSVNPATRYYGRAFTDVQCHSDVLDLPMRWKRPRRIFVNSMSDLFHPDVPDGFIAAVFRTMAWAHEHQFQVLTKRPERMQRLLSDDEFQDSITDNAHECADWPWPLANVWLGVSVEDQAAADARIPLLLQTPAAVRWISAEPLLGPVDLTNVAPPVTEGRKWHGIDAITPANRELRGCIDWVVCGGESGPHARPMHPEWARSLRDQCAGAGIPFLFKQWGEWLPGHHYTPKLQERDSDFEQSRYPSAEFDRGVWDIGYRLACETGDEAMYRVGKNAAGRLLDGVEHNGYPS